MPLSNPGLWARMLAYDFPLAPVDSPQKGARTLYAALCAASGLDRTRCARVLEEYRRFIYLVAVGAEVLAPSPLIDFVWHIHLGYRSAYVDDFCGRIIGRPIRHNEGRPKAQDDPAYHRTLQVYQQEFGQKPDLRMWPDGRQGQKLTSPLGLTIGIGAVFAGFLLLPPLYLLIPVAVLILLILQEARKLPWSHRKQADSGTGCGGFGGIGSGKGDSDGTGDGGGCGGD
jgi:hypothetical protein